MNEASTSRRSPVRRWASRRYPARSVARCGGTGITT
jgi:hypothetical protein